MKAHILRIEKISPNDGAGLRTVVFFKGCPLKCKWCSTPESLRMTEELYCRASKCASCGKCVAVCPHNALAMDGSTGKVVLNKGACTDCFRCAGSCPSGALGIYGKEMTVAEVMKHIQRDEIFYYHSGGGVTLSGGDILCQPEFARELAKACKDHGIHTMAELSMFGDYKKIEMILPYLDEFYVDIKLIDAAAHKEWTGVDNKSILENTAKAAENCKPLALHIRVPLVWGVNDSEDAIRDAAAFCQSLVSCAELEFLPYHRLGQATYEYIGQTYPLGNLPTMTYDQAYEKVSFLKSMNLPFPVKISGKPLTAKAGGSNGRTNGRGGIAGKLSSLMLQY